MKEMESYRLWLQKAAEDPDLIEELKRIEGREAEIQDRFYRDLEFGTGGLRGVIGAGSYRMNIYTVRRATQGLADYLNGHFEAPSAAIAYDSRIKSDVFAREAAGVLAANGVKVYLYRELMPTPMLSYAVRTLKTSAGIVVTASHNPSKYNGYKVYGADGCQLTLDAARLVLENIERVDMFDGPKVMPFEQGLAGGRIEYIGDDVIDAYLDKVKEQSLHPEMCREVGLRVVYTPLNGTGNRPVRAILKQIGVEDVFVVPEQEHPDGNFPTVPYPNPEIRQAFECAIRLAESKNPDLLLATDPDCDRVGIAVAKDGEYVLMSGNEVGAMLLDYLLSERQKLGTLPQNPVAVKTIVTTAIVDHIAAKYGCQVIDVLTGFKFIGEQIGFLEQKHEEGRYVFGFEESYGYLAGTYVRDKDGVVASMLICEMAAFYKKQGKTLVDVMDGLYREHGYYENKLLSFTFEGSAGMEKMDGIMNALRNNAPDSIGGLSVVSVADYQQSKEFKGNETIEITLPKSNVLSYRLTGGAGVIVRPSGTEPKIKIYLTARGATKEESLALLGTLEASVKSLLGL